MPEETHVQYTELAGSIPFEFFVPGTAAGTAVEWPQFVVPWNATIAGIIWVPGAAVTANGTNFATISIRNRSTGGGGTVVPSSRSYAATNSSAQVAEALTLSATATDLQPSAGDVLTISVAHSGTGLTIPAGLVQVALRLR
jgi:hypothetical protein